MSLLHIIPFSMVSLCHVSLKGLSTIEQLLHIFLFILSGVLLNMGSYLISILIRFQERIHL